MDVFARQMVGNTFNGDLKLANSVWLQQEHIFKQLKQSTLRFFFFNKHIFWVFNLAASGSDHDIKDVVSGSRPVPVVIVQLYPNAEVLNNFRDSLLADKSVNFCGVKDKGPVVLVTIVFPPVNEEFCEDGSGAELHVNVNVIALVIRPIWQVVDEELSVLRC